MLNSGIPLSCAAALIVLSLSSCASWKTVEHTASSDPFERISATYPVSADTLRQAFLSQKRVPHHSPDRLGSFPNLQTFFVASAGSDQDLFPDDGTIRTQLDRCPWLKDYLSLPKSSRSNDLYLYSVTDLFWPSEYEFKGESAKF